jgi:hypothetical protein
VTQVTRPAERKTVGLPATAQGTRSLETIDSFRRPGSRWPNRAWTGGAPARAITRHDRQEARLRRRGLQRLRSPALARGRSATGTPRAPFTLAFGQLGVEVARVSTQQRRRSDAGQHCSIAVISPRRRRRRLASARPARGRSGRVRAPVSRRAGRSAAPGSRATEQSIKGAIRVEPTSSTSGFRGGTGLGERACELGVVGQRADRRWLPLRSSTTSGMDQSTCRSLRCLPRARYGQCSGGRGTRAHVDPRRGGRCVVAAASLTQHPKRSAMGAARCRGSWAPRACPAASGES